MSIHELNYLVEIQLDLWEKFHPHLKLRISRALSWLSLEKEKRLAENFDARFIFLWIGFNALYAKESKLLPDSQRDLIEQDKIMEYFNDLVPLDKEKRIYKVIRRNDEIIEQLLRNKYIFYGFWNHKLIPTEWKNWCDALKEDQKQFERKRVTENNASILAVLRIVFDRLYTVRKQLMHGSASKDDELAWEQVNPSTVLLSQFLTVFIELTMKNYNKKNWGPPHYPRVCGKPVHPFR